MIELNKIYLIDVLEGMKLIEDNSIDLIITSPPYNLGNNHHTGSKRHNPYNDSMPEDKYQEWQLEFLNECFRVLKDDGSMMYNHKNRIKNGEQITPYLWILKSNFIVKQEIVWINRSQNFDKIRFYPWTERIYWLVKNKNTKLNNILNKNDVFDWNEWKPVGTRKNHTRAFPEQLVVDLISVFPKSKVVLDPFMGSGTTAKMALLNNRKFIGFESSKEYFEIANKRIESLLIQTSINI